MIKKPKTIDAEIQRLDTALNKLCGLNRPEQITEERFVRLYDRLDASIEALRWIRSHKYRPSNTILDGAPKDMQAVAGLIDRRNGAAK